LDEVGFYKQDWRINADSKKGVDIMLLRQTRINSLNCLSNLPPETKIRVCVQDVSRFPDKLSKFGFAQEDAPGSIVLPAMFNRYACRNAEQFVTVDRSAPREKYTQTVYWTRHEWAGRGETREVTDFTDIVKERFHRDYHMPYSVYFTLISVGQQNSIESDELVLTQDNNDKIMNTINMVLGLFGECSIEVGSSSLEASAIRLDWDILPPGDYPWEIIKGKLEDICKDSKQTQKQMMLRNCNLINEYNPDFIAYGRSGFRGYIVFGFCKKNLFFLESIFPNNATYIFESDWEELSKLTKSEILNHNLQKGRLIHNANWPTEFEKYMNANW